MSFHLCKLTLQLLAELMHDYGTNSLMLRACRVSKSFRERVWYTTCHDPLTFIYMFMYPFALGWSIAGLTDESDKEDCDDIDSGISGIAAALLVYLLCTVFVAMISCCWEVSRLGRARYEGSTDQSSIPPAQMATHMFVPSFSGKPGMSPPPHSTSVYAASASVVCL